MQSLRRRELHRHLNHLLHERCFEPYFFRGDRGAFDGRLRAADHARRDVCERGMARVRRFGIGSAARDSDDDSRAERLEFLASLPLRWRMSVMSFTVVSSGAHGPEPMMPRSS